MPGLPNRLQRIRDSKSQVEFAKLLEIEQTSELEKLNNVLNQISHLSSNTEARVIKNVHRKKNPYKTLNSNGIINYSLN